MNVFPMMKADRFEQMAAGELFFTLEGTTRYYALKTSSKGLVTLGPNFPGLDNMAAVIDWQPLAVMSLGTDFTVLLPTQAEAWTQDGPSHQPVCLAVFEETYYVCANGSEWSGRWLPWYVDLKTGEVVKQLPGRAAYTNAWEIALMKPDLPSRTLLSYPLPERPTPAA